MQVLCPLPDSTFLLRLLEAADDPSPASFEETLAEAARTPKPSLDDLFAKEPKPKPDWPS